MPAAPDVNWFSRREPRYVRSSSASTGLLPRTSRKSPYTDGPRIHRLLPRWEHDGPECYPSRIRKPGSRRPTQFVIFRLVLTSAYRRSEAVHRSPNEKPAPATALHFITLQSPSLSDAHQSQSDAHQTRAACHPPRSFAKKSQSDPPTITVRRSPIAVHRLPNRCCVPPFAAFCSPIAIRGATFRSPTLTKHSHRPARRRPSRTLLSLRLPNSAGETDNRDRPGSEARLRK